MRKRTDEEVLRFVTDLANRSTAELGFLPDTIYAPALLAGRLHTIDYNGELAGFILCGPPRPELKIYQTVVEEPVRFEDNGRRLFVEAIADGLKDDVERIRWRCAEDLEANAFWRRVACDPKRKAPPRGPTRRACYEYVYTLPRGGDLDQWLEQQFQKSKALAITKLCGVEGWYIEQLKRRWRKELKNKS